MARRRIEGTRIYTAHPISDEVRRKAERIRNKNNLNHSKRNNPDEVEFSEKILFEKWKEKHGK